MKHIRILTVLILLLSTAFCYTPYVSAKETATDLLDKVATNLKNQKSLKIGYTISADSHQQNGILTISGERFSISSPQIASWYDGKTQWTYSTQTNEVNITEPTDEELQQVNPFAIIKSFREHYKASMQQSSDKVKTIDLKASNPRSDIADVSLTFRNGSLYPSVIKLTLSNRQVITININTTTPGGELPISEFQYDEKSHPEVPVVDLR